MINEKEMKFETHLLNETFEDNLEENYCLDNLSKKCYNIDEVKSMNKNTKVKRVVRESKKESYITKELVDYLIKKYHKAMKELGE